MTTGEHRPGVAVVVLLASAGGLNALSALLGDLPADFGAAVIVQQHLGGQSSVLPTILHRSTGHRVSWARDGQMVEPGHVIVCPPDMHMEVTPQGCCRLRRMRSPTEHRFDVLLASVAASYGPRGLAVVLSGSGRDGAEGVAAMKRAGAFAIAQSPDTAEYPSMPIAAAQAGADLVLPINVIGDVLASIVEGAPPPCPSAEAEAANSMPSIDDTTGEEREAMETEEVTGPPRGGLNRLSLNRTANTPAGRAEAARRRAAELQRRRRDLAAGLGATAQSVAIARRRAEESLRRAMQARQAANHAAADRATGD
ncbi:chemotaxis protein CheB [Mycobacterium ahvazicum]|uniref:protein-glutamate methylesterase n=1 Tax=Mycobacterium ahvazicum TaxID=1964395 RepID=A0A2K4Y7G8_9MYCO|nr:chemotaxis protein CheB [Mycobacterium ahvazicum]SOX52697.1 chemotaxis protein CheB [Mycobacterium ahvazicum]